MKFNQAGDEALEETVVRIQANHILPDTAFFAMPFLLFGDYDCFDSLVHWSCILALDNVQQKWVKGIISKSKSCTVVQ